MNRVVAFSGSTILAVSAVTVIGQSAFAETTSNYKQSFTATLSGDNEVPAVMTDAKGSATFGVSNDERSIDYAVTAMNAEDVTAAHIHCAEKGKNGPVIAGIFMGEPTTFNGEVAKGTLDEKSILPAAANCSPNITTTSQLVQAMREGKLYVNVHSVAHPDGLIRGQIEAKAATTPPVTPTPPAEVDAKVIATVNPDGVANDALVGLNNDLSASKSLASGFMGITSIQSAQLGADGKGYATADAAGMTGAIITMNTIADKSSWTTVMGANTGLVAPKGIEVIDSKNALIVSDNGTKDIKVFASNAVGNAAPMFTVSNLGGVAARNVWDTSYDKASDTLYVAATDGAVLVYNDFFMTKGVDGPTKLLIPSNANKEKVSVNLHGIAYVPERDSLVLSDVGDAANATDGQLFTLNQVRTSSGRAPVTLHLVGANTMLGNPVDLAYDGQNVYVAEKSNDRVLKFNDVFGRSGMQNVAANQQATVLKPESVDLK